jgi:murein DD-endopeptidase MepM/ murein hydrolase activator NlpD
MAVPEPDPDRTKLAGNHVLLDCGGTEVLLAHLQRGSVLVAPGEHVTTGQRLGLIGNSGNTTEPHLHVSAQRRHDGEPLIGGVPVWVTVNGRYLVRNDRLVCVGDGVPRE